MAVSQVVVTYPELILRPQFPLTKSITYGASAVPQGDSYVSRSRLAIKNSEKIWSVNVPDLTEERKRTLDNSLTEWGATRAFRWTPGDGLPEVICVCRSWRFIEELDGVDPTYNFSADFEETDNDLFGSRKLILLDAGSDQQSICSSIVTLFGQSTVPTETEWRQVSGNALATSDKTSMTLTVDRGVQTGPFKFRLVYIPDPRVYDEVVIETTPYSAFTGTGYSFRQDDPLRVKTLALVPSDEGAFQLQKNGSLTLSATWNTPDRGEENLIEYRVYRLLRGTKTLILTAPKGQSRRFVLNQQYTYQVDAIYRVFGRELIISSDPLKIDSFNKRLYATENIQSIGFGVKFDFIRTDLGGESLSPSVSVSDISFSFKVSFERYNFTGENLQTIEILFHVGHSFSAFGFQRNDFGGSVIG